VAQARGVNRQENRGRDIPRYEFLCEKCKKSFELIMTISEREKAQVKCPTCEGTKVVPQFSGFMAQTGKKS
jgi:putative FmdB family regulatory protein